MLSSDRLRDSAGCNASVGPGTAGDVRTAVSRAAADSAVDGENAAAARAVGGGAADGAGRSALGSGVRRGSVRGNVQGTHD